MVDYLDHVSCEDAYETNTFSGGLLRNIGLNVPKEIQFFLIKCMLCQNNNISSIKSEDSNLVEHHKPKERRENQNQHQLTTTNINFNKCTFKGWIYYFVHWVDTMICVLKAKLGLGRRAIPKIRSLG
jgi:hypothetical protein